MIEIIHYTDRVSPLDGPAREDFLASFESRVYKRGEYLVRDGQVSKHYYFIQQGLVKSFSCKDGKEFIMTFFRENMLFTEISSFLTERPSRYMVVALETTTVYSILKTDIEALCRKHHCIETLFRKLFSFASIGMMKRISEMLEDNATERYGIFLSENGGLLQRISLGDLSSYLGITQVSLSRIRSGK
jgi:CRP-like cAMP-binding protein